MTIIISPQDPTPLYAQIVEQMKRQIADGTLQADEQLPSIRNLAKQLEVSVITTKRAYEELEREGLIYSIHGRGSFVQAQTNYVKTEWLRLAFEQKCEALIQEGRALGLSNEEMLDMLRIYIEEETS